MQHFHQPPAALVQEQQGGGSRDGQSLGGWAGAFGGDGRLPCTIDCELREGLIERCTAGETVSVTGIVKTASNDIHGGSYNNAAKPSGKAGSQVQVTQV